MLTRLRHPSLQDKATVMRRCFLALCLIGLSSHAVAADLDWPLRGPARTLPDAPHWGGLYVGGQFGYGAGQMDFGNAFNSLDVFSSANTFTAPLGRVSSWATFGTNSPGAINYGGFFGYNSTWEDAVLGVEINYNHFGLRGSATSSRCYSDTNPQCSSAAIVLGDDNSYDVTVNATAAARVTDYATFRGRAGWAYGSIMPYAMVGLAVGRVETTRFASASGTPTGAGTAFVTTEGEENTRYVWGVSAGVGVDFMLMSNLFARAEYEFVQLNSVLGKSIEFNTIRVGVGAKF